MKNIFKLLVVVFLILLPFILSGVFIAVGTVGEDGRYSLTGEKTKTPDEIRQLKCELKEQQIDASNALLGVEVPQDAGSGCQPTDLAQMGSNPYYRADVSTPTAFYNAVNGKGFNEGYGYQCVAAFKQFMFSLSGKYVATNTGGASGYAKQQGQIEQLGFKWHAGTAGLQDGDWGIFGGGQYGHVAMRYQGKWFGQNQGAADPLRGNVFNLLDVGTSNLIGYYRPNIYQKKAPAPTPSTPKPATDPATKPSSTHLGDGSYTVRRGDTLGQIVLDNSWQTGAGLWGTLGDANKTAQASGLVNPNLIFPGQVVVRP